MFTKYASESGEVTDRLIQYHVRRARGGVALIVVENTCIDWALGRADGNPVTIHHDRFRPRLHDLVEAVHHHGVKIVTQLHHAGRQNLSSNVEGNQPPPAPSAVQSKVGGDMPRAMTEEEIEKTIQDFADGARRTKECGFDGVEIHGAHGYLLSEFISPLTNLRTDKWGGSFENRCRFAVEIVRRIRSEVGPDFPLLFRFSADEKMPGALQLEEGVKYAKVLESEGVDCLDVSGGFYDTMTCQFSMQGIPAGAFVPLAAAVKAEVSIPVIAVNSLGWDLAVANDVVSKGSADLVHMGRGLLADPEIPNKIRDGRLNEIRPCIRCNECLGSLFKGWSVCCVVNPELGHEYKRALQPASRSRRIVVVGAGPAGLEYAVTTAERGHRVTLFEKDDRIGGQLNIASIPAYKRPELGRLIDYYDFMLKHVGVDLRLGSAAKVEELVRLEPDLVILALGSGPLKLSVPGGEHAKTAVDVLLSDAEDIGDDVCVIGGNGVGLDTALFLREKGKNVTILEMRDDLGSELNFLLHWHMTDLIEEQGVEVCTGHKVVGVSDEGVTARVDGKTVNIECDDVVAAVGFEPVDAEGLAQALRDEGLQVVAIGSCVDTGRLLEAIRGAFWVAAEA
jgi:2,4-dienoyl-CoA reductase-like NADH-dependent reductase (Old Yellow Enzyme family)/thioredoxin reductase